jgi:chorismate-pyruvate lyase
MSFAEWAGRLSAAMLLASLSAAALAAAPTTSPWHDDFVGRLEALAVLQSLNADLLSHDSATLTLERWCDRHHLASPARISAQRVHGLDKAPDAEVRRQLQVDPDEPVSYRRVSLRCGEIELSDADNWYVPARLTPEMAQQLDHTDEPFGKVVQSLHFQRHTLSAQLLWAPLPDGWELQQHSPAGAAAGALFIPPTVLEHRAVLTLPNGSPISEVVETYSSNVLSFLPTK